LKESRDIQISNILGEKTDDLIINASSIFPVEMQVSEIFSVGDKNSFNVDKKLKCWMQASCNKAFVSLFVAHPKKTAKLDDVRKFLIEQPLMDGNSVLAHMKTPEITESGVKMYQQVIDFEDALLFDKKGIDGTFFKNQGHSCT